MKTKTKIQIKFKKRKKERKQTIKEPFLSGDCRENLSKWKRTWAYRQKTTRDQTVVNVTELTRDPAKQSQQHRTAARETTANRTSQGESHFCRTDHLPQIFQKDAVTRPGLRLRPPSMNEQQGSHGVQYLLHRVTSHAPHSQTWKTVKWGATFLDFCSGKWGSSIKSSRQSSAT